MTPGSKLMPISIKELSLGFAEGSAHSTFETHARGGVLGIKDPEVLRIAAESGRILLSHDRRTMPTHFAQFLQTNSSPGVIIISQDLDIGTAIEGLLIIWAASGAEEWRDQLGFLPF
jgi:hypothetical protein